MDFGLQFAKPQSLSAKNDYIGVTCPKWPISDEECMDNQLLEQQIKSSTPSGGSLEV